MLRTLALILATAATGGAAAQRPFDLLPLAGPAAGRLVDGELRCSFARGDGAIVLLAAADVNARARATAAIRLDRAPIRLIGIAGGGFGALTRGGQFRGAGIAAKVARGSRIATGSEETRHHATLVVERGRATRLVRGVWSCGP